MPGMFDMFQNQEQNNEEKLLDKQLNATSQQQILANATDPNADMTYIQQQQEKEDLVRWQQDLVNEMELMEHDLKREYLDDDGYWKPTMEWNMHLQKEVPMKPSCNDKCLQMIRTSVRPMMSRNIMMSNFNEERILQMLKRTMQGIVRNMCLKYDEYDVEYFDISYILSTIKNYIIPAPFRALGDGERKHGREVIRRVETINAGGYSQEQQKKGMFSMFSK